MPKSTKIDESCMINTCEAVRAPKNANFPRIAREYGVPSKALHDRVKKGNQPRTARKPVYKALQRYQEEALLQWIVRMRDLNMPVSSKLLEEYANQTLQRAGDTGQVSKVWVDQFEKRLPEHLKLGPVEQKHIEGEDAGLLGCWYNQLAAVVKNAPARVPDLAESGRGESITAIECVAADGWQVDPWFIFKGSGISMEWFNNSEALPSDTTIATSPSGRVSDEVAVQWLQDFIKATNERTKMGENRILIFDRHSSHLTVEFLQMCEENGIIPFGFLPRTTHLCQPLAGKLLSSYRQHFWRAHNELSYWAGEPVGKSGLLRLIGSVREKAFDHRIIREAFEDRGIWPVSSKIADDFASQARGQIPDIYASDLSTPSMRSQLLPATIQALEENLAKLSEYACLLTAELQRVLEQIYEYSRIAAEHLAMANEAIN
ncbi:hypothetical protein CNMCM8714_005630 [Aspergillus fumigatus]|nr:hypothetical protein CNMCM8714_005630 [Aspergillus fumigatus]